MTDREAFEDWHSRNYDTLPGTELHSVERQGMRKAWIAALASERAKQAEPVAIGHDGKLWPHTIDAKAWADEFCKRNTATDNGTMIGWFANAIEFARAYDSAPPAVQSLEQRLRDALEAMGSKKAQTLTAGDLLQVVSDVDAPPAVQAEPVATVVGTSDLEGRVQWRQSQRVELGTKLYTPPPADDEAVRLLRAAKDYLDRWEARPSLQLAIDAYLAKENK